MFRLWSCLEIIMNLLKLFISLAFQVVRRFNAILLISLLHLGLKLLDHQISKRHQRLNSIDLPIILRYYGLITFPILQI
jgi:hypothetical protein